MPKLKKGDMARSMDTLGGLIEMHQKADDITDLTMAHLIRPTTTTSKGMHERTFRNKVRDPETFTVRELMLTVRKLGFTEDEMLKWIRPMLKGEQQ